MTLTDMKRTGRRTNRLLRGGHQDTDEETEEHGGNLWQARRTVHGDTVSKVDLEHPSKI